uniref:Pyridoxamine 5'-phosphate oxidase Alr4036 family FMN-binding domain-containing protein n=1 Tax=Chromera velia CCMP2878 TaxID=1169474 RepID=A0A0G4FW12_9ALVE|eukprot:Cvel_19066.t1-p1 / transcript=Cvel_19066.t1 / gene=Cvel_19066 / organism=Chromera_velia_CCMP2878 / gene_product=Pyridoxine/pyridoxamine 5'-phosphate oxidase 2, putative / transcript_product=Pyridoxine/pyridoxamine 5'-phosphate oxidase 2, putative / location=Cvel_scaffold1618:5463-8378(+) / protein_length=250 / sequence_SO=supercontig / SO=protein_coding / is_pseudo=false
MATENKGLLDIGQEGDNRTTKPSRGDEEDSDGGETSLSLRPRWVSEVLRNLRIEKSNAASKYFQIATVSPDQRPSVRTVVFRGFVEKNSPEGVMKMITDGRSLKIGDLKHQPDCEVCWYFEKSREQFRIRCEATVVSHDHSDSKLIGLRKSQWNNISENARKQFIWPHPGKARPLGQDDKHLFSPDAPGAHEVAEHFCLILLAPYEIDWLALRTNERLIFRKASARGGADGETKGETTIESAWESERVNP